MTDFVNTGQQGPTQAPPPSGIPRSSLVTALEFGAFNAESSFVTKGLIHYNTHGGAGPVVDQSGMAEPWPSVPVKVTASTGAGGDVGAQIWVYQTADQALFAEALATGGIPAGAAAGEVTTHAFVGAEVFSQVFDTSKPYLAVFASGGTLYLNYTVAAQGAQDTPGPATIQGEVIDVGTVVVGGGGG